MRVLRWVVVVGVVCVGAGWSGAARAADTLRVTFESDTIGQPPGEPDVGLLADLTGGTFTVVDVNGDKWLEAEDAATDGSILVSWFASGTPQRVKVSYRFRIEEGAALVAVNAFTQVLRFSTTQPTFLDLNLWWGNDPAWRIFRTSADPAFGSFELGRDYRVVWGIDFAADTFDLTIDGVPWIVASPIGIDAVALTRVFLGSNTSSTGTIRVDDVRVEDGEPIFEDGFETNDVHVWAAGSPVGGDECQSAHLLPENVIVESSLGDNTGFGNDDSCGGSNNTQDEWWAYTASCTGTATVTTCIPGQVSIDTVLAAYVTCGAGEVACNDDDLAGVGCGPQASTISFPSLELQTFYLRVSSFNNNSDGSYRLRATCEPD